MNDLGITEHRDTRVRFADAERDASERSPDAVIANDMGLPDRLRHGPIYRRIETNQSKIETAMRQKADGTGTPHAPFDMIALAEEM